MEDKKVLLSVKNLHVKFRVRGRVLTAIRGISLDQACQMPLSMLMEWVAGVPTSLPEEMRPMAENICQSFQDVAKRLMDLGLGYLSLDRAASTLSTGERQRMQLARAVRNRTTGVLYVLDEPSIGLHPSNIVGLTGVMHDLVADGNSVLLVDHDTQILSQADWLIEMGPQAGANGGQVVTQGTIPEIAQNRASQIGPFLAGTADIHVRDRVCAGELFALGRIHLSTAAIHTVKPLKVDIPKGRLTVVTGVSGSGKTTLILESLVPGLAALSGGTTLPEHVLKLEAEGIRQVKLIDATPIGVNVRSTVATYANVHDELRKIFARTPDAKELGFKAGDFSYNTGKLRCPVCDGTGTIDLDVQFLPDVTIPCPECQGSRYGKDAGRVKHGTHTLPELMAMFRETADIKTADQLHLPVPEVEYHTEKALASEEQKQLVQELSDRAAAVHAGQVNPKIDNMLAITNDARKLGLDQRLINPLFPDNPASKVNMCVENVFRIWEDGQADKLTQLIFCDRVAIRCYK